MYLGDIVDNHNETNINYSNQIPNQYEDDDEDALLSQALDAHQEKEKVKNSSVFVAQTPPPAKKVCLLKQELSHSKEV